MVAEPRRRSFGLRDFILLSSCLCAFCPLHAMSTAGAASTSIVARVDSDWATDKVGRRSTSSGHLLVNGAVVAAFSRTQATPALSSAEANVEGKTNESSNVAAMMSGMAKCLAGLSFFLQAKGSEGMSIDGRDAQAANAAEKIWATVMDFTMQVLVILLAVVCGYAMGKLSNKEGERISPARIGVVQDAAVDAREFLVVQTSELTMESLRARLREAGATVGGNKDDLVLRYDMVRRERPLHLARPP